MHPRASPGYGSRIWLAYCSDATMRRMTEIAFHRLDGPGLLERFADIQRAYAVVFPERRSGRPPLAHHGPDRSAGVRGRPRPGRRHAGRVRVRVTARPTDRLVGRPPAAAGGRVHRRDRRTDVRGHRPRRAPGVPRTRAGPAAPERTSRRAKRGARDAGDRPRPPVGAGDVRAVGLAEGRPHAPRRARDQPGVRPLRTSTRSTCGRTARPARSR